ncbi:hypothetical protein Dimus_016860 [Dionaea muscipula]
MFSVLGKSNSNETSTAAHPREIITQNIIPKLIPVDNHGGQRGHGVKDAAVHDHDPDLGRIDQGLSHELVDDTKNDGLGLFPCLGHGPVGWIHEQCVWSIRGRSDP